ncbi:MAG: hypothetical protein AAGG56_14485 [Pseudomonadota bacterium]
MIFRFSVFSAIFVPLAAFSEEVRYPAIYDVNGIDPEGALIVYTYPDTTSEPLGVIPPDAKGIEVVDSEASGDWAEVNVSDGAGWVQTKYLTLVDSVWDRETAPEFLSCFGEDPIWWAQVAGEHLELSIGTLLDHSMEIERIDSPEGSARASRIITANNPDAQAMISFASSVCVLTSPEYEYALSVNVLFDSAEEHAMVTGCCSLTR